MKTLTQSLNCDGNRGRLLLAIALALLLLALPEQWMRVHLSWDRDALPRGELWRLATAHIVHLDLRHALLNVAGLALVWALFIRRWTITEWLWITAAGMLAIDAGLWWLQPQLQWYVGASGVLHGLLAAGLVAQWRADRALTLAVGALLVAKLAWEARHGALPFAGEDVRVVLPAHRYGAAGGLVAALALTLRRKWL